MHRALLSTFTALAFGLTAAPAIHAQTAGNAFLRGGPAATSSADRVITLNGDTRWVNVKYGETVRFTGGKQEFSWKFDGPNGRPFDLSEIAPAGALAQAVTVYVQPRHGLR